MSNGIFFWYINITSVWKLFTILYWKLQSENEQMAIKKIAKTLKLDRLSSIWLELNV